MLKRTTLAALAIGGGLLAGVDLRSQGGAYKIVVNPSNPTTSLSKAQVSNLFLRKTTTWESGEPALPVDQSDTSPLRDAFARDVLGMAADQATASVRGDRPPSVATDREVLAYVRLKPGAIGYVSSTTPADGVKVVSFGRGSASSGGGWQDALKVGGAVPLPTKVVNVAPVYPATAKLSRQEGVVEMEILIGPTGAVEDTKLVKPVLLFNDAAIDAVRQWKYSPTIINGTAVSVRMLVRVTFALH
jgi:TonB family protein